MDPTLWGPLAWNLIFDINWGVCQLKNSKDLMNALSVEQLETIDAAIQTFYQSLQFILPCKYCRASYRKYLEFMDRLSLRGNSISDDNSFTDDTSTKKPCTQALRWAYDLKNKVNDKLGKSYRPTFEQVLIRMQTLHSFGSQYSLMDFFFIIAENYDAQFEELQVDPNNNIDFKALKHAWFYLFIKSVSILIAFTLATKQSYAGIAAAFRSLPIEKHHVLSKQSVTTYLCQVAETFMQTPQSTCRRSNSA